MSSPDGIETDILRAIRRMLRRVSLYSHQLAQATSLTVPQLLCLRTLLPEPNGLTMGEICRRMQLSPATVTGIADRLERAGLVVRVRRADDRRKVTLALTELGRARAGQVPTPLQERFLTQLTALPEEERLELLRALERVVELMDAAGLDASPILVAGELGAARARPPEDAATATDADRPGR